ncbi:peroxiredoxin [Aquiluna sp. KACHI24]|uniref:peroxiredoxin n=1 Tax=Aquiluna sp. KACHI24 TaxID=2968831 RepID=UPI0022012476|nr:peroxiredoxin [Aquiluna sp. KACHI24]BDP99963.1 putative peroxiredoxin [Aquiluna sp. KACHI24]
MSDVVQRLSPGDKAPDFSLLNQDGETKSLSDLLGTKTVLYFYPAAGSPGCTKEAADFQDALPQFEAKGYKIVGVSPDPVKKLKSFEDAHELTFALLSDENMDAHRAYGAYGEKSLYGRIYKGALRSTILIDENGVVVDALYNVKATGHTNMLLKRIG